VEEGNRALRDGSLPATIKSILGDIKAEASYFTAECGKRTAYVVTSLDGPHKIPAAAEPWFQAFNAEVEFYPAMTLEDLTRAGVDIEQAAKKYSPKR